MNGIENFGGFYLKNLYFRFLPFPIIQRLLHRSIDYFPWKKVEHRERGKGMVIKLRSIINKIISIGVCVLLSFSMYKKCTQEPHVFDKIIVQTDALLADQTCFALTHFIKTNTIPLETDSFCQTLISQFPCVAAYELEKNASGDRVCTLEAAQPILTINNEWVLTHDGRLATVNSFNDCATHSLRNIIMPNFSVSDALCAAIPKLSPELFQSYNVIWINDQESLLCDRLQPNFSIRFNVDSVAQSSILQQCSVIKNDLESRGFFASTSSKKKPQHWIADIRFKNQIVISRNVEGAGYG